MKDGLEPWAEIRDESCSFAFFIPQYDRMIKCIYKTQAKKRKKKSMGRNSRHSGIDNKFLS